MAKKKTTGPEGNPDTPKSSTASPRRRAPGRAAQAADAADRMRATDGTGATPISGGDGPLTINIPSNESSSIEQREPTFDEIAQAAYQRYMSRGGNHGQDVDDWIEAERELRSRRLR